LPQQRNVIAQYSAKAARLEKIPLHIDDHEPRLGQGQLEGIRFCFDDRQVDPSRPRKLTTAFEDPAPDLDRVFSYKRAKCVPGRMAAASARQTGEGLYLRRRWVPAFAGTTGETEVQ